MRQKVIDWEREHGYKARFVARKLNISDATWHRIKYGIQPPTLEQVEKFQKEFGIEDVFDFFREEECHEQT